LETSARTGESVEEAFLKCSKTILAKIETGELDPERMGSGNCKNVQLSLDNLIGSSHFRNSIWRRSSKKKSTG